MDRNKDEQVIKDIDQNIYNNKNNKNKIAYENC